MEPRARVLAVHQPEVAGIQRNGDFGETREKAVEDGGCQGSGSVLRAALLGRGLNEHTNGLVRQYFPKATDFRKLDPAELERVETLLNNRPRKALGYRTPAEVQGGVTGPTSQA